MLGGIVRGKRATLRVPTEDDLPHIARWCADMRVRRFGEHAYWDQPATAKTWKERLDEASKDKESVLWAIEADGACVGSCLVRGGHAFGGDILDIGHFTIDPDRWGAGLGYDAALALHRWIFDIAHLRIVSAIVTTDNARALRVTERLGYVRYALGHRAHYRDGAYVDVARLRMELATWDERFGASEREYPVPLGEELEA